MDNFICFSWNNTSFSWKDANITWREACLLKEIVDGDYICFSWSNLDMSWLNADITWKEACILNKAISGGRGIRRKDRRFTKDEKKILISLVARIKENGYIYNVDEKKEKNAKVKVTSRDLQLFIKELKQIKVKASIL